MSELDELNVTVVNQPQQQRYELLVAGEYVGELVYRNRGGNIVAFLHTEVDPARRLRGLGSLFVREALDDARARGLRVVPVCPFVDAYMKRHPEYEDLVVPDPARRG